MSLEDIKDHFSVVKIDGKELKVSFGHKGYFEIEDNLKLETYDAIEKMQKGEIKSLKQRLYIIWASLIKHQKDITLDEVYEFSNVNELWDKACLEFMRVIMSPAIFSTIEKEAKETEKKILTALTESTGGGQSQLQPQSLGGRKKNSGKKTLEN